MQSMLAAGRLALRRMAMPPGRSLSQVASSSRGTLSAGERLCRDIENGVVPLPRGFDTVTDFHFFLRLAGARSPPDTDESILASEVRRTGRLIGMDEVSTRMLLEKFGEAFGIPPPDPSSEGVFHEPRSRDSVFKDVMMLFGRDPPVPASTISRLTGVALARTKYLLHARSPLKPLTSRSQPSISRLRDLCFIWPPILLHQAARLLSSSEEQITQTIVRHLPECPYLLSQPLSPREEEHMRAKMRAALDIDPLPEPRSLCVQLGMFWRTFHIHGPNICPDTMSRWWSCRRPTSCRSGPWPRSAAGANSLVSSMPKLGCRWVRRFSRNSSLEGCWPSRRIGKQPLPCLRRLM
ncbi:hypothetical protein, variant 2 [Fonticula alba]|uniref:Uncharacterized protein n=1 Tax=Fonticula alba TaxID=691883 RepID=A0A058ZB09_FONAL|nr:hypothetical protein, variant 1 [Fonticula alba]XP_009494707.1 hypothetical protein, variant 2 [Fonticula alba]KCV71584.1 hypothetical protein, variant 1 [Fonticula alba]KCV71585.1 hypothetical protein, variant 2 [Fonticula alba]|eukprot:XP_009494706.1 hypothetical protein, variant 1 [Fonticula alba]